jgi:hypothetical protein
MFDLPLPIQPSPRPMGPVLNGPTVAPDPSLPFALTRMHQTPAGLMSGTAAPVVVERFPTLVDAMQGAFEYAKDNGLEAAPQLLAILDCDQRLVLAGAASHGAVAWCHPVANALEARAVVTEAVQLRAQAGRATDWHEPELAQRLRHRADLLDARLVDPLWRAFAARALQIAA